MNLAGIDLAWHSEKNPSAIAYGELTDSIISVTSIDTAVYGIDQVIDRLRSSSGLSGIAIDAPLIIKNLNGQRPCEKQVGRVYGSSRASCHTSNTKLYPDAKSVYLSESLVNLGFSHLDGPRWQIECYPHPAIIEIFALSERLKYKKGLVGEKKKGQVELASLILALASSDILPLEIGSDNYYLTDSKYIESLRGQSLKSNEDSLDALICLYIAGLYSIGFRGSVFGDQQSGYIWIPSGKCI